MIVLSCPMYNIYLHKAPDYKGQPRYLLVYGLQATGYETMAKACKAFNDCLAHAREANPEEWGE